MVGFYWLTRVLFVFAAFWAMTPHANASFPATTSRAACAAGNPNEPQKQYTGNAVLGCGGYLPSVWEYEALQPFITNGTGSQCRKKNFCTGYGYSGSSFTWTNDAVATCPANATLTGNTCTCASGFTQNGTTASATCEAPAPVNNCPAAGTSAGARGGFTSGGAKQFCDTGASSGDPTSPYCSASGSADFGAQYPGVPMTWSGDFQYTHSKCNGTGTTYDLPGSPETPASAPAPSSSAPTGQANTPQCADGQPGTINGVQTCVPFSPDVRTEQTKTSSTTTGVGTPAEETKKNDVKTSCTNGTCTTTTTTTTTTSSGTSTTVSASSEPIADFCKSNPQAKMCDGTESAFSGSCASGFVATGDAVIAAMAKEIYTQNCKLNTPTTESAAYDTAKTKTGNQTSDLPGNDTVNLSSSSFDSTDAIGGAACLPTLSFTVWNKQVDMPFTDLCDKLLWFKNILLLVAFMTAAKIVREGVK